MILELVLFTAVLSVDSFSAAIALGFLHFSWRSALFFALSSGLSKAWLRPSAFCSSASHAS